MNTFAFLDLGTPDILLLTVLVIFIVAIVLAIRLGRRALTNFLDSRYVKKDNDLE